MTKQNIPFKVPVGHRVCIEVYPAQVHIRHQKRKKNGEYQTLTDIFITKPELLELVQAWVSPSVTGTVHVEPKGDIVRVSEHTKVSDIFAPSRFVPKEGADRE